MTRQGSQASVHITETMDVILVKTSLPLPLNFIFITTTILLFGFDVFSGFSSQYFFRKELIRDNFFCGFIS
eukprot:m.142109 g.142109  ORF g.142109 m.142109 type:complete len:71 (+) comp15987_c1_seq3:214-426(+)